MEQQWEELIRRVYKIVRVPMRGPIMYSPDQVRYGECVKRAFAN